MRYDICVIFLCAQNKNRIKIIIFDSQSQVNENDLGPFILEVLKS